MVFQESDGLNGKELWAYVVPGAGDFDEDGDVDLDDLATFLTHMRGPQFIVTYGCVNADLDGDGDGDLADFHLFAAEFGRQTGGPGDIDQDDDVDLSDLTLFVQCIFGPDVEPLPVSGAKADLDGDGDCDMGDFAIFAGNFTGTL